MLFAIIVFLSAFLLFQIQPILAKLILPIFGGGAAIWTSCLLFFQTFLLCGYVYAHALTQLSSVKRQVQLHAGLLVLSAFMLPIGLQQTETMSEHSPLLNIIMLLVYSIGIPYFVLSATGPLVQRWFTYRNADSVPYRLYSLSNIGSLLALVSYPFLIEPMLAMQSQTLVWSITYGVFVIGFLLLCWSMYRSSAAVIEQSNQQKSTTSLATILLWLGLSATGVILLVSTTSAMTQNIPPMPFLWILPLCLYLVSFIICFNKASWYVRWYWFGLFIVSSIAAIFMFFIGSKFDIVSQIGMYSVILLSACMICHGELAKLKPQADKLTLFYLYLSLGGALGSLFVSFAAPQLFTLFYEFPLAIIGVYLLFAMCLWHKPVNIKTTHSSVSLVKYYGLSELQWLKSATVVSALLVVGFLSYLNAIYDQYNVASSRNFYGILSVKDVEVNGQPKRSLIDGSTSHGSQSLLPFNADIPMSYYNPNTGVATALKYIAPNSQLNAGFIGLGAGALAAYGKKGDSYHFYEINPDVEKMAKQYFTFVEQSAAEVEITLGDGRVSLARQLINGGSKQFDVLVVDAFSGSSIPIHLLTLEAFHLYNKHLADHGALAIHISNTHLGLAPLIRGFAAEIDKQAIYFRYTDTKTEHFDAEWIILTNNKQFLNNPMVKLSASPWPENSDKTLLWTDDYSHLLSVLR